MSLTGKRWQLTLSENNDAVDEIAKGSKISPVLSQVLVNRGIMTVSEADSFVTPKLNYLASPYDIPEIEKGAKRVLLAKERGEKVVIWGDYDVDGVTGTTILMLTLKDLKVDVSYYIPHRYTEGYGLNAKGIEKLASEGVKLIITVDCGISNMKEVELANQLGLDVVITDHHNAPKELPRAHALVNPKLIPFDHKSRELAGAGVAFKFAWALYRCAGITDSTNLMNMFDLAALGTIADVVPLKDENRILAVYGLKSMNISLRPGIKKIIEAAGIKKRITTSAVNYAIAPRLNSAGRLEHASLSVELLMTQDEQKAKTLALELSKLNTQRQSIGTKIQEEAFAQIEAGSRSVILSGADWNPGVIGIVASRIVDKYYRPAVLIGVSDGYGRGSARSVEGLNIYEMLLACADLFEDFGGHKKAAGFKIKESKIPELKDRLKILIESSVSADDLIPILDIEAEVPAGEVTMNLASELELLQPHGEENPSPTLATMGMKLVEARRVGDGTHLKAKFTDGSVMLDSIGFSLGVVAERMELGERYDVAYNLEINEFNGLETVQMKLVDIRRSH